MSLFRDVEELTELILKTPFLGVLGRIDKVAGLQYLSFEVFVEIATFLIYFKKPPF
jgi:hypothetical protein